ncbi:MAG: hypothetical protein IPL53_03810 [Ignavibacteria bacterium]|nr:hypothetical protein [Ignavibacteria bacterium]
MSGPLTMDLKSSGVFSAGLKIASGSVVATDFTSPRIGRLYGPVTVDSGATLGSLLSFNNTAFSLEFYGDLTNNGTITSAPAVADNKRHTFKGSTLINNGIINPSIFNMDSTANVSGTGTFSSTNYLSVGTNGNITLLSNVNFSPGGNFYVLTGGILNPNGNTLNYTAGTLEIQSGGTILNSGLVKTQNAVTFNLRGGSFFNAPVNVPAGSTLRATDFTTPYIGRLYGNVTVDSGGTLGPYFTSSNTAFTLEFYGNLTNNGTLTAYVQNGNKKLNFKGSVMVNNGIVNPAIFSFDSTSTLSGSGSFAVTNDMYVGANGNVTLLSDVNFAVADNFFFLSGATMNPNGFTINFTQGALTLNTGATIAASGLFKTQNAITFNLRAGSAFNAPLKVTSGSTVAATDLTSPYLGKLFGDVTIDAGGTLGSYMTFFNSNFSLDVYGNVTNNGTIIASTSANKVFSFYGSTFVNNGLVSHPYFSFKSVSTLSGTGSFTSNTSIQSGAAVTLNSNHQFWNMTINAGGAFDISNRNVGFTASNPIAQNGTFTTTNSEIIYNGTALQTISTTNIIYSGLKLNNSAGATLSNNITIPDTLAVILGDLNLNGKIITITPDGYMTETPGNTVFGTTGYITTTRDVGTPSALNVAGMGAVLTTTTNLGSTEVRRGHAIQTGLNGGTSIRRYYDITPTVNTGLNATLVYKFDDSELNGKPEPLLKLFKSTNSGSTWQFMGGIVNIASNDITITGLTSFSRWSADSSKVPAAIGLIQEGFYNIATNNLNMTDTVRAYLRNATTPYAVVDSAVGLLDSLTFKSGLQFSNAATGSYYIQLKHRNSLETWSKNPVNYIQDSTLNYDFTFAATQAYGNNMVQKGTKYCLYSGDVTQNGFIDLTDVIEINNNATNFVTGYVATDANGNSIVDLTDVLIAYNNSINFVTRKTPLNP